MLRRSFLAGLFALAAFASPVAAQVTFDAKGTATDSGCGAGPLDNATLTVGTGSSRAVAVMAALGDDSGAALTFTWDNGGTNLTLTKIGEGALSSVTTKVGIWAAVAPASGNKTIRAAYTGNLCIKYCPISFAGVDQTGGATSFPHFTSNNGTSANPSIAVTSATNNMIIAGITESVQAPTNPGGSPNSATEWCFDTAGTFDISFARAAGAATETVTWTVASDTWAVAGTDILAAGGGAAASGGGHLLPLLGVGK